MTAARALARSAQHILGMPAARPRARRQQPDDPDRAHRSRRRRGRPHARFPATRPPARQHRRLAQPAGRHVVAGARREAAAHAIAIELRRARRAAAGLWRPRPIAAGDPQFRAQCDRGDRAGAQDGRTDQHLGGATRGAAAGRDRRLRQRARHRQGARRSPVRAADDLEGRGPGARLVDLRGDRRLARRARVAAFGRAGRDRVPVVPAARPQREQ